MRLPPVRALVALSTVWMMSVGVIGAEVAPCQLTGEWVRDDNLQRIELYPSDGHWFGRIVSFSDSGVKPGFIMLRDFASETKAGQFKGTVVVPTSGTQASGDLICIGPDQIKVTGHKLFFSKSHTFTRAAR
jgi:hypothetical protein